jgi:hypothetical protein
MGAETNATEMSWCWCCREGGMLAEQEAVLASVFGRSAGCDWERAQCVADARAGGPQKRSASILNGLSRPHALCGPA